MEKAEVVLIPIPAVGHIVAVVEIAKLLLGLAVEIKMEYWKDFYGDTEIIVSSDDVLKPIKSVMEEDSEVRKKVKEMSRISEKTLVDGGSSFSSLGRLIEDMMGNMS
ncbi:hypothetical protein POTOM_052262 [Populus tomentosa]|uniref:Uncharacterized protein n=1 Tax=Populus tomentosa TaxID=118781 RepID=A0A8X7XZW3_POPTO|nr:hypothetical protein POTOM_052262 [Populus tomentosa]